MNAIPHETQEQLGPATVGGLAKPAFDGAVRLSQRATMKAAVRDRYGAPDLLYVREIPRPQPAADEVLLRVRASSVNAADWRIMRGRPLLARPMFGGILRPAAGPLGSDVAGVVEAVGNEVTDLMPGDEVFGNADGAFAEYVTGRAFVPKPANLSFAEAAAIPLAACTALQALRDKGGVQAGQRVLVTGAGGGVGTFAVQLAKAFGAHVTAVSRTENLDMLRAIGADAVIDYTREDFTCSGRQFDLIVDVSGTVSLRAIRRAMGPDGALVIVGAGKDVMRRMAAASVRSRLLGQRMVVLVSSVLKPDLATLKKLAQENTLRPVIDTAYPLDETIAALRHVETGRTRGKVVVTVAG
jgi:NADPH:quinone reductase-like Zn-dependent oxidoreductase